MSETAELTRRMMLAAGFAASGLANARAQSVRPGGRRLMFEVWRNHRNIGHHSLVFQGGDRDFMVAIDAQMAVSLGPIALFRYHHQATETWRGGQFAGLRSQTVTNGNREQVAAVRTSSGVAVKTLTSTHVLDAATLPLTHWNRRVLEGPMFNPETGAAMREKVSRLDGQVLRLAGARPVTATRYAMAGDADIIDWYDPAGVWIALSAKVRDGSSIDYRAVA